MEENSLGANVSSHNTTTLDPLGLTVTILLGMVLVIAPRRYAIAPMILLACFVPSAQRLVVMGADFSLLRILVLFAWGRMFIRDEFHGFAWNRVDAMLIAWKISGALVYVLAYGTPTAFVNRCGWMFDGFGMYFFFRCMLRDWSSLYLLARTFILISLPVAVAFCLERASGTNIFSVLGGVPASTVVREGRLRCQGAYSHAILAGCFWVAAMPLMFAYLLSVRKWLGGVGVIAALVVVVNCASSTPILAVSFMILGMLAYFARHYMRALRWGFFLLLLALHTIMEAPVWHLLARVNVVGGSTGWHRYRILDATINNLSNWWLLGEKNPLGWGVREMIDITNQYILEALRGGLLSLVCFVVMIGLAFGVVGRALRFCENDPPKCVLIWCIGTALFVHVCIFFAVSYFGQIIMMWYLALAMAGSLPQIVKTGSVTAQRNPMRLF